MRPRRLSEFVGQESFLGEGKLLRRLLKADRLGSAIFYGPPASAKRRSLTSWQRKAAAFSGS
jgi:putative ATPase